MPELVQLEEEWGAKGLRVVAVSMDLQVPLTTDSVPALEAFVRERGFEALEVVAFEGDLDELNARWDAPGPLPFTFVLDRQGRIVDREEEPADFARLAEMARAALESE